MSIRGTRSVVVAVAMGLLAGCASSPPVQFYTLSAEAPASSVATAGKDLRIDVGPVSLPEMVDRPQFVIRSGQNRVTMVDEHRWAESLASDVPRVLAENLSRLLTTDHVWAYPQHAAGAVDYRVLVDIQRFESTPGQRAVIEALWTVQRPSQDGGPSKTGRSSLQQPVAGQGYEALAAAHSRALAEISREIAEVIRSFTPSTP